MRALEVEDFGDDESDDEIEGFLTGAHRRVDETGGFDGGSTRKRVFGILSSMLCMMGVLFVLQRSHQAAVSFRNQGNGTNLSLDKVDPDRMQQQPKARPVNKGEESGLQPASKSAPSLAPESAWSLYQCPNNPHVPENVATAVTEHEVWYESVSRSIKNVTAYMETFRMTEYDNWGHSFSEVKRAMFHWKSKQFRDVPSGAVIYESACGIGLNLLMTLEILHKVHQVVNVTVYGNDYVPQSVEIARTVSRGGWLPAHGRLGTICTADSTNLSFVPSNSFDVVFTGYISPLFDPLQLALGSTDANFAQYTADCEQRGNQRFAAAQQRQNDWYAAWVGEMIRVAKPGAPIIVEQVSYPYVQVSTWTNVMREWLLVLVYAD
jgi:SAM-dependent methyltransferase